MTIPTEHLDLIKRELTGIRDFYEARLDAEVPPIKEELDRVSGRVAKLHEVWREGERRALLNQHAGGERPRVHYGKYAGLDHLDLACVRSLLAAQQREPSGMSPRMLEDWQTNLKAAMDSTTAGAGDELVDTQEARALWDDVNLETAVAPLFNTIQMPVNPAKRQLFFPITVMVLLEVDGFLPEVFTQINHLGRQVIVNVYVVVEDLNPRDEGL